MDIEPSASDLKCSITKEINADQISAVKANFLSPIKNNESDISNLKIKIEHDNNKKLSGKLLLTSVKEVCIIIFLQ